MTNHSVKNLTNQLHGLSYLELFDLASQILVALDTDSTIEDVEKIPKADVDKMARALIDGSSYWDEITNS